MVRRLVCPTKNFPKINETSEKVAQNSQREYSNGKCGYFTS